MKGDRINLLDVYGGLGLNFSGMSINQNLTWQILESGLLFHSHSGDLPFQMRSFSVGKRQLWNPFTASGLTVLFKSYVLDPSAYKASSLSLVANIKSEIFGVSGRESAYIINLLLFICSWSFLLCFREAMWKSFCAHLWITPGINVVSLTCQFFFFSFHPLFDFLILMKVLFNSCILSP